MRGRPLRPRAESVAEAQRLRAGGLKLREISERMGAPISTVHEWITDPDLSKHAARRRRNGGTCADCGSDTDGSYGPAKRCAECAKRHQHETRHWNRERVVTAIQEFAARYGRPPVAYDWNPPHARALGHPERAERFARDGCWPYVSIVLREYGSWNLAIAAAGFTPQKRGQYQAREEAA